MTAVLALLLLASPPALEPATDHPPNPWQVGPAPSAQAVSPSWNLGADVGALWQRTDGQSNWLHGVRMRAGFAPHPRVWTSAELGISEGWRTCLDCRTFAGTWTVRGLALNHRNIRLGAWSVLTGFEGQVHWTPGVALDAGTERFRIDTSWMVWSTWDFLTVLRSTPELGMSFQWGKRQSSRIAVVGLEPAVAIQHRVRLRDFVLAPTVRVGEEGVAFELGVTGYAPVPWAKRVEKRGKRSRASRVPTRSGPETYRGLRGNPSE